ncbi:MAG: hypothetical protein KF752_17130 [Pirellulaceae bacterium]|nr:hypothetical protein [Pirellulaceae bacterium]
MSRRLLNSPRNVPKWIISLWMVVVLLSTGCANRPRAWGFPGGQGTIDRQKSRAVIHDPFPLNDIAPEVEGGRPREFFWPQPEAIRETNVPLQYRNMPPNY